MKEEQLDCFEGWVEGEKPESDIVEEQYEYLEIAITKELISTVYLKVPLGYDKSGLNNDIISKCVDHQIDRYDWEDVEYYYNIESIENLIEEPEYGYTTLDDLI